MTEESDYSYESDAYDSESDVTEESDYSYDSEYDDTEESDYSYDSEYDGYGDACPNEEDAYIEDEDEYTYEYEYSNPEEKYGEAEGLNEQADDDMGEPFEDESDYGYEYDQSQEGESAEAWQSEGDASTDGQYVDPCEANEHQLYDGYDSSEGMPGEEPDWDESAAAESAVWGVIVSWASRSLEEMGDACHGLSRQISDLHGKFPTVGSRQDRSVR